MVFKKRVHQLSFWFPSFLLYNQIDYTFLFATMTSQKIAPRDVSVDILRIIGLFCIILAHTFPPLGINNLRSFDVPFMVVLSGYLFTITKSKNEGNISLISYVKKRFIRLVLPTWIFLTFFFGGFYFLSIQGYTPFPFSYETIQNSYLLWTGIGYVWIIRIYFWVALFGPPLVWILKKIPWVYLIIILLFFVYESGFRFFAQSYTGEYKDIIIRGIFFLVPYLLLFLYGAFFKAQNKMVHLLVLFCFFGLLYYEATYHFLSGGNPLNLQDFKYPAREAYLYYGLFCSTVFLLSLDILKKIPFGIFKYILSWIWSSTLWIYLAHIPIIYYFQNYLFPVGWQNQFLCTVSLAIAITLVIQAIVYTTIKIFHIPPKYSKVLLTIFCS